MQLRQILGDIICPTDLLNRMSPEFIAGLRQCLQASTLIGLHGMKAFSLL